MKRLAVVGGGISGLAAARTAYRLAGSDLEIVVLERDTEVGGKARSRKLGPWLVETGPMGFLSGEPTLERLVDDVGLTPDLLAASASVRNRYLVRGGRLRTISPHPVAFLRSGLLGASGALRLLGEPFVGRSTEDDESVWDFAARRLGRQVADRLVAPMVLGVFAGDSRKLSMASAFPMLHEFESEHGSLLRGMMKSRRSDRESPVRGTLHSFPGGMQTLPRRLATDAPFQVMLSATVESLERRGDGWLLGLADRDRPIEADAVVLACEAFASASLLEGLDERLSTLLREIPYPPVAVVAMGFPGSVRNRIPSGFGALVPRSENLAVLGILFDSYVFPDHGPDDALLVRVFLGGAVDPETTRLDDEALIQLVRREMASLLSVDEAPIFSEIVRWPRAIPQYEIGHARRVATIEDRLAEAPGLFLAGNALHGIAYGKAVAAGVRAGEAAAERLAHGS